MSLILFCLLGLAPARAEDFVPHTVSAEDISRAFANAGPYNDFAVQLDWLPKGISYPGLRAVGWNRPAELTITRALAKALRRNYDVLLLSRLEGFPTPVFSGLIFGKEGHVAANFRLIGQNTKVGVLLKRTQDAVNKIERYSAHPENFERLALEGTRLAAGLHRDAQVERVLLSTPRASNMHRLALRSLQRVVALFAPGRPTWVFADLPPDTSLSYEDRNFLERMTRDKVTLVGILLRHPRGIMVIRDGVISEHAAHDCRIALSAR